MEITKLQETESKPNPHNVDARPIYTHENAQVIVLTLQPGESLRRLWLQSGLSRYWKTAMPISRSGDEKQQAGKDSIVHSPAKIVHCWYNTSDKPLRILVAKTPSPKESTILL